MKDYLDAFWTYTIAIAAGLIVAWLLSAPIASPVGAEPVVLSFTDPQNCPPCKVLDASWRKAQPKVQRQVIDVRYADRADLAKWGVDRWPTTILVEMEGEECTKVYRRHVGAMTAEQLLDFVTVPR